MLNPRRVAQRHLIASALAENAAKEMFLLGTSPDGGEWHGGPPKIIVSFSGADLLGGIRVRGGRIEAVLEADPSKWADGIYTDSFLVQRFLKVYPGEMSALREAFMDALNREKPRLVKEIERHYENPAFAGHLASAVFGFRESQEWETPTKVKVEKVEIGSSPVPGKLKVSWAAKVSFEAAQKEAVTATPFADMTDRELDGWISRWESDAPENFWMDGELTLSRPAAYKMYRDRWRKMPAREQVEMLSQLQRG